MPFSSWRSSPLYPHFFLLLSPLCSLEQHAWAGVMGLPQVCPTPVTWHLRSPFPCLWSCTAPRAAGCGVSDSWQFQSWCFGCRPCSLPSFRNLRGTQGSHSSVFAEHETYRVSTEQRHWFFFFSFFGFSSNTSGFSHLIPLELGFLFILCCFLCMHCLCPAVVCYNDMGFLFLSLTGNKGWWESNADHPPPPHHCTFWGRRVVCICRRQWCRIQETRSQDIFYSTAITMQDHKKCLRFKMFYLMFKG